MSHDLELPELHSVQDIDLLVNKAYDAIISAVATSKLVQEGRCLPSDRGLGFFALGIQEVKRGIVALPDQSQRSCLRCAHQIACMCDPFHAEKEKGTSGAAGAERKSKRPEDSIQRISGSLLDLAINAGFYNGSDVLEETKHMQPTAVCVIKAVAEAVQSRGSVHDTHASAPLLKDPGARPDCSMVIADALVMWSAMVLTFELKLDPSQSALESMTGQVSMAHGWGR